MARRPSPEFQSVTFVARAVNEAMVQSVTNRSYHAYHREHNSSQTPNYRMIALHGMLPSNPYVSTVTRISPGSFEYINVYRYDGRFHSGGVDSIYHVGGSLPFALQPPSLVQEAKNKAFLRMSKQASAVQVNLAQFFGERKQCAEMFAATAHRISQAALALRRADLRTFVKSLGLSGTETRRASLAWKAVERTPTWKRIPSFWLEYVYGWKPLLSDVYASAELVAKAVVNEPKSSGTMRSSATVTQSVTNLSPRSGASHLLFDKFSSHNVLVRAKARYWMESEARSLLATTGISNPALLAWELLPYSFVVDWFYPVGNYLESLTAFDGFELTQGTFSTLERSSASITVGLYNDPSDHSEYFTRSVTSGDCLLSQARYTLANGTLGFVPTIKSPIGGEPLSRFATATSLLSNLFTQLSTPPRYFR